MIQEYKMPSLQTILDGFCIVIVKGLKNNPNLQQFLYSMYTEIFTQFYHRENRYAY